MGDKFGLPSTINQIEIRTEDNITGNWSYNDLQPLKIVPLSSTVLLFTQTTVSSKSLTGDKPHDTFQYYIIGVYAFFVSLFVLGILIIVVTKFYKACCVIPEDDYDSASRRLLEAQNNSTLEHHVNVDPADLLSRIDQEYDSEYDNYSDISNDDKQQVVERPPDYEEPPSYSATLQP